MTGNLVTLITPTGGRPDTFAQCERYMARQTYKGPMQWVVIDDCDPPTPMTYLTPMPGDAAGGRLVQEYHRGPKLWREGINTQRLNMDEALKYVKGDYIFVIEDDDWYSPDYIQAYVNMLQYYPAVGEGNAKYYNVEKRMHREWNNYQHASLCQTGFRRDVLPILDDAVNSGVLFMDIAVWQYLLQRTNPLLIVHQNYVIGTKGLPGRFGIGAGHSPENQDFKKDPMFEVLKAWVKDDWQWYSEQVSKMVLAKVNHKR